MDNRFEKYMEAINNKSSRNIDNLIDESINLMARRQKRVFIIKTFATATFACFALFVTLINTSVSVQAFVLQNDVLKTISKPLIFNNIFEEAPSVSYVDDVVSIDYVLNNFESATIKQKPLPEIAPLDSRFVSVSDLVGTSNSQYVIEIDTETEEMDYPALYVWKRTESGLEKVYTYSDVNFKYPILALDDVLYVVDRQDQDIHPLEGNYYEASRTVYAVEGNKISEAYNIEPNAFNIDFFVKDGKPNLSYVVREGDTVLWKTVDLTTNTLHSVDTQIKADRFVTPVVIASNQTRILTEIDMQNESSCGNYADVKLHVVEGETLTNTYKGCAGYQYKMVSDRFLFGQSNGDASLERYHIIDLERQSEYTGSDVTAAYNMLSQANEMVTVLRLTANQGALNVSLGANLSNEPLYIQVGTESKDIIVTGSYDTIEVDVQNALSLDSFKYEITKQN